MNETKILHIITKLAIGGAQENTIYSAEHFNNKPNYSSEIICGYSNPKYRSLESKKVKITQVRRLSNHISFIGYYWLPKRREYQLLFIPSMDGVYGLIWVLLRRKYICGSRDIALNSLTH